MWLSLNPRFNSRVQTLTVEGGLSVAQLSNDGSRIAAGAKESKTYVWTLDPTSGKYK